MQVLLAGRVTLFTHSANPAALNASMWMNDLIYRANDICIRVFSICKQLQNSGFSGTVFLSLSFSPKPVCGLTVGEIENLYRFAGRKFDVYTKFTVSLAVSY